MKGSFIALSVTKGSFIALSVTKGSFITSATECGRGPSRASGAR
jgi:hypothetical protein